MNIFDYIKANKDKTFTELAFTNVDNILFSMLAYNKFENLDNIKNISIKELYEKIKSLDIVNKKDYFFYDEFLVLEQIIDSKRYKDIIIKDGQYKEDVKEQSSFAAITFKLPTNLTVVAYRGTTESLISWKENLNMAYLDMIPSAVMAINYLNFTPKGILDKVIATGHSKGGNLAVLASINCNFFTRRRLYKIFNNDGPGFIENIMEKKKYSRIKSKIHTFLPKYSIVGRIFNCSSDYKVIKAKKKYFMQHLLVNWQIDGTDFVYEDELDSLSINLNKFLIGWANKVNKDERQILIDILYNALLNANITKIDLNMFNKNIFINCKNLLKVYSGISKADKKILNKHLLQMYECIKDLK